MEDWMDEITYDMLQPKQQELADIIGLKATLKLCEYVQGGNIYIPQNARAFCKLRNRLIRRDYTEGNWSIGALARKYRLTEVSIRGIIKDIVPRQTGLFDE